MTSEDIEEFYARVAAKEAFRAGKIAEPPPPFVLRKRKEYEMPDDYQRQLAKLSEMLEKRDEYTRIMPSLPPDTRSGALPVFRDLCDAIESIEQQLADEYERCQEERDREESQLSVVEVKQWISVAKQFLFIKKYEPQTLEAFKTAWMEEEEWLDIARWIDRIESEGYDPPPAGSD